MSSHDNFQSASRYEPDKQKSKVQQFTPMLTGFLFLFLGINYLSFAIKALGRGENFYFIISLLIFASFVAAFVMLRKGIALEKIYRDSKHAKSPSYPLKTIAGSLLALSSSLSALLGGYSLLSSLMLGAALLLGWYLYYGFDPRKDKISGYDNAKSAERIMKLLVQANEDIHVIQRVASESESQLIRTSMQHMAEAFLKMVKHIENEPDDYDRARKYLVSYLGELRLMSETFIKLEKRGRCEEMRESFLDAIDSSIEKLDKQYERLLDEDMVDLDVKLSVMKKRLESEE
ncbi:MAG: 5-bromo-4-chloroindolyl phosphate hydrolysis family protein [Campylobacterota bacterium]|nr:5-bromo-4-chloroindolyl phosphate hydrolysis family protein [Campylobacterota bacterium]